MRPFGQVNRMKRESLAGALANRDGRHPSGDSGYRRVLEIKYKRYDIEKGRCFFCRKYGKLTGHLPTIGPIRQCGGEQCRKRYSETRELLEEVNA